MSYPSPREQQMPAGRHSLEAYAQAVVEQPVAQPFFPQAVVEQPVAQPFFPQAVVEQPVAHAAGPGLRDVPSPSAASQPIASWVAVGAGIAGVLGSFMPWAKFTFFGEMSVSGVDGSDGWFSVGLGAAVAACALWRRNRRGRQAGLSIVAALCALALLGLGIFEIVHLKLKITESEMGGAVSVGAGLWLIVAAGAVGAVAVAKDRAR